MRVVEDDRGGAEPVLGFVYDDAGRLARVDVDASPDTEYAVNAYGERVSKQPHGVPAAATHYHYGLDGTLLAESEADGDPAVEYIVLPGGLPLAVIPDPLGAPAGIAYVHPDHLGAAAAITDSGEDVDWELVAGPFGELEDASGSLTFNPRFPGQYADAETGVRYNLMRDYDPSLGRYLQSDPIGLMGGLDTYTYVGGNPVNYVDPFGLWTVQIGFTVGGTWLGSADFSIGIIVDDEGNGGYYGAVGYGAGTGAGIWGGIGFAGSTADTICDVAGPFRDLGASGGVGVGVSGSYFWGDSANGPVDGASVYFGPSVSASVFTKTSYTWVDPALVW